MRNDVLVEVAKAAPPVTVAGFTFIGHPLSDWEQLLTIAYTTIVLLFLIKDKVIPWIKNLGKE